MSDRPVPRIFDLQRRFARVERAFERQECREDSADFLWRHFIDEMHERLAFLKFEPTNSLIPFENVWRDTMPPFVRTGARSAPIDINLERPMGEAKYDFVGIMSRFDAINDPVGALIHIRNALMPGGLSVVSFVGGASLPRLRTAMLAADGDRPFARVHPMIDPRAAPQLLQRAGWKDPVVDSHRLKVRYSSLEQLVHDLRDQGLTSALADRAPPLGKAAYARAQAAFLDQADEDGKVTEIFEIITLTGRRSLAGT